MIISRTPLRISFFGGGTDFPLWYNKNGGSVISTTIDKYIYISTRSLDSFFKHNLRISYSIVEEVENVNLVKHPSVREVLKFLKIKKGIEIHYDGDLPGKSGLGSSSSFTVGLLNCLNFYLGNKYSKSKLLQNSLFIEQKKIRDIVGSQDQVAAVYGGLNNIKFSKHNIKVNKINLSHLKLTNLQDNLLLVYTGILRSSNDIVKTFYHKMNYKNKMLDGINSLTNEALKILKNGSIDDFGLLLNETWQLKKKLSSEVTNPRINNIYQKALKAGAIGGKLLGAGGGGFLLLYANKKEHENIKKNLSKYIFVPFQFENTGSKIIYNSNKSL